MGMRRHVRALLGSTLAAIGFILTPPAPATGEGQKLTAAELKRQFADRPFGVRSTRTHTGDPRNPSASRERADGGYVVVRFLLRSDGSATFTCQNHTPAGVVACATGGSIDRREVDTWAVEDDAVCWRWLTSRESRKNCYAIHRSGRDSIARRVSGPWGPTDGSALQFD